MKKIIFKLSFVGLLFLTTINTTTPSNQIEKINIIDQTSEQSDLPSAKNKPFFALSINEILKIKIKPILKHKKFILKLIVLFGSVCLILKHGLYNSIKESIIALYYYYQKAQLPSSIKDNIYGNIYKEHFVPEE